MEKYVFYVNGSATKVFAKSELSKSSVQQLKQEGYKKYQLEFDADSKQEAIKKLNENSQDNLDSLSQFSGSYLFLALFPLAIFILVFIFR